MEAIESESERGLKQLSRQDFSRFLEKGKQFYDGRYFPEQAARTILGCLRRSLPSRREERAVWQMINANLSAWILRKKVTFFGGGFGLHTSAVEPESGQLQPPRSDKKKVTGFL